MSAPSIGGDLVLSARPVAPEAFAPFGKLLGQGDRARLGGKASLLVAIDSKETAPRRVMSLQRFPEARRLLASMSDASFLLVVAGAGERPLGPATAFRVPGASGVVLDAGVWHAGPIPLADGPMLEAMEVMGPSDRLDRVTVAEAFGAEGLRVMTEDEFGAPAAGVELADEFALTIADGLRGRVALGCLAFDGLSVGDGDDALRAEGERLCGDLRRQWGDDVAPADIPGLAPVRELYRALGIDPTKTRPASEALLRRVLQGKPLPRVNSLVDAMNLCSLRTLVPFGVYDRARVAAPVVLRWGAAGEGYDGIGRGRIHVDARPVLADRDGPFGNPTADSLRTGVSHGTSRALVVLYLPPTLADAHSLSFLDAASAAVLTHCGGHESGRRIVR